MEAACGNIEAGNFSGEKTVVEPRTCTICFETWNGKFLKPCKCTGSMRHVHEDCLMKWISINEERHPSRRPSCNVCKTEYLLKPSPVTNLVRFAHFIERLLMENKKAYFLLTILLCAMAFPVCPYGITGSSSPKGKDLATFVTAVMLSVLIFNCTENLKSFLIFLFNSRHSIVEKVPLLGKILGVLSNHKMPQSRALNLTLASIFDFLLLQIVSGVIVPYLFEREPFYKIIVAYNGVYFMLLLFKAMIEVYVQYVHSKRTILDYTMENIILLRLNAHIEHHIRRALNFGMPELRGMFLMRPE